MCMSNNAAERELRAVAVGRKNWTFAGSDEGGRRAAAIYTLIQTAKLNDIEPAGVARRPARPLAGSSSRADRRSAPLELAAARPLSKGRPSPRVAAPIRLTPWPSPDAYGRSPWRSLPDGIASLIEAKHCDDCDAVCRARRLVKATDAAHAVCAVQRVGITLS
jgi:hypothetical protein